MRANAALGIGPSTRFITSFGAGCSPSVEGVSPGPDVVSGGAGGVSSDDTEPTTRTGPIHVLHWSGCQRFGHTDALMAVTPAVTPSRRPSWSIVASVESFAVHVIGCGPNS